MCIIHDFVQTLITGRGFGYFADDWSAVEIASALKRFRRARLTWQHRQNRLHDEDRVPKEFLLYLQRVGIIPEHMDLSTRLLGRTVSQLLEFLYKCPYEDAEQRAAAEHLRSLLLVSHLAARKGLVSTENSSWQQPVMVRSNPKQRRRRRIIRRRGNGSSAVR